MVLSKVLAAERVWQQPWECSPVTLASQSVPTEMRTLPCVWYSSAIGLLVLKKKYLN